MVGSSRGSSIERNPHQAPSIVSVAPAICHSSHLITFSSDDSSTKPPLDTEPPLNSPDRARTPPPPAPPTQPPAFTSIRPLRPPRHRRYPRTPYITDGAALDPPPDGRSFYPRSTRRAATEERTATAAGDTEAAERKRKAKARATSAAAATPHGTGNIDFVLRDGFRARLGVGASHHAGASRNLRPLGQGWRRGGVAAVAGRVINARRAAVSTRLCLCMGSDGERTGYHHRY